LPASHRARTQHTLGRITTDRIRVFEHSGGAGGVHIDSVASGGRGIGGPVHLWAPTSHSTQVRVALAPTVSRLVQCRHHLFPSLRRPGHICLHRQRTWHGPLRTSGWVCVTPTLPLRRMGRWRSIQHVRPHSFPTTMQPQRRSRTSICKPVASDTKQRAMQPCPLPWQPLPQWCMPLLRWM